MITTKWLFIQSGYRFAFPTNPSLFCSSLRKSLICSKVDISFEYFPKHLPELEVSYVGYSFEGKADLYSVVSLDKQPNFRKLPFTNFCSELNRTQNIDMEETLVELPSIPLPLWMFRSGGAWIPTSWRLRWLKLSTWALLICKALERTSRVESSMPWTWTTTRGTGGWQKAESELERVFELFHEKPLYVKLRFARCVAFRR